jgi:di-N-acetylchitobiase
MTMASRRWLQPCRAVRRLGCERNAATLLLMLLLLLGVATPAAAPISTQTLAAAGIHHHYQTNYSSPSCPCHPVSLCGPVTVEHQREVMGWGARGWTGYDWDTLTMIAHTDTPEMICTAHKHQVRVLLGARMNFSEILNGSARAEWIRSSITEVRARFADGLYLDYEKPLERGQGQLISALTSFVREAGVALRSQMPTAKLVVATAWSPDDIDGRDYDYVGLSEAADYLFVMNYDTRSAIYGRCIASANAPLSKMQRGVERHFDIGVAPNKLILGLPWYGYDYPCLVGTRPDALFCPIAEVPFRGVNCSDAAGRERPYAAIMAQIGQGNMSSPLRWDDSTQSPFFNYIGADGTVHQQWFDSPESLGLKYALASERRLKGVGFYATPMLDPFGNATRPPNSLGAAQTAAMWASVRHNFAINNSVEVKPSTKTFLASTERIVNPERGFRHELDDLCGLPPNSRRGQLVALHQCKKYNMSIAQTYCYLNGETDTITNETLALLSTGFAKLRAAGVKVLLRFAYDRCRTNDRGEGNYTTARIVKHIRQLAPVVNANIDIVYVLQAGFVGCWGEWHSSRGKIEFNSSQIAQIVAAELHELLPVDRKITMRYP